MDARWVLGELKEREGGGVGRSAIMVCACVKWFGE